MPYAKFMDTTEDDARQRGIQVIEAYEGQDGSGRYIASVTINRTMPPDDRKREIYRLRTRVEMKGYEIVEGMGKRRRFVFG